MNAAASPRAGGARHPEMAGAWPMLSPAWAGPSPGQVDCVSVCLTHAPTGAAARLRTFLTRDELGRVDRYVHADDRLRALIGRAALRVLLARATGGDDPRALAIEVGRLGKPFLRGGPEFNLSHGGKVVLLGFAAHDPVGINVEPDISGAAWPDVVPHLHPIERAGHAAAADPASAFLRIWTRKEAVAKATGLGFMVDPRGWAVSVSRPGIVVPPPGTRGGAAWSVFDLVPASCHVGAVAVQGSVALRCWSFVPDV